MKIGTKPYSQHIFQQKLREIKFFTWKSYKELIS